MSGKKYIQQLDISGAEYEIYDKRLAPGATNGTSIATPDCIAEGDHAIAVGNNTEASGPASFAEGSDTKARGKGAHAENTNTKALGEDSHAGGNNTEAIGDRSSTEGLGTIATGADQHVQGRYNIVEEKYAHIVGNGTSDEMRSNAYTLDWEGNAEFAGNIKSSNFTVAKEELTEQVKATLDADTTVNGNLQCSGTIVAKSITCLYGYVPPEDNEACKNVPEGTLYIYIPS